MSEPVVGEYSTLQPGYRRDYPPLRRPRGHLREPRGQCSRCHREVAVTAQGRVRPHAALERNPWIAACPRCPGAGEPPLPEGWTVRNVWVTLCANGLLHREGPHSFDACTDPDAAGRGAAFMNDVTHDGQHWYCGPHRVIKMMMAGGDI